MKERSDLFGKKLNLTGNEALQLLECSISEGWLSTSGTAAPDGQNLFGRTVWQKSSTDLSLLAGLLATGLRAGVLLDGVSLSAQYDQLADLVRQHLPAVVHYATPSRRMWTRRPVGDRSAWYAAGSTGCFQFFAADLQELIDFTLMAHKLAECALLPGLCAFDGDATGLAQQEAVLPTADEVRHFLGDPDSRQKSPTPAQRLIFGEDRRRIPQWFSSDMPTLNGMRKQGRAIDDEAAARERFFYHHLPELLDQVFADYGQLTGRHYSSLRTFETDRADYITLAQGAVFHSLCKAATHLRLHERSRAGAVHLPVLRPFPKEKLKELLHGKKGVAILEGIGGNDESPLLREIQSAVSSLGRQAPPLYSVRYAGVPSQKELEFAYKNMLRGGDRRRQLYLGIDFLKPRSTYPQHEILLQGIRREYSEIGREAIRLPEGKIDPDRHTAVSDVLPFAIRRYEDQGPPYTRLSRFCYNTAYFYQHRQTEELVADPFQAVSAVPSASANFTPAAAAFPVFRSQNCTACGDCFTYCPHSAMPPLAIGMEAFLRGAMNIAAKQGAPVAPLTPVVRHLAKAAVRVIRSDTDAVKTAGDILPAAFEQIAGQMKMDGDKREKLQRAVESLLAAAGTFSVAIAEPFFKNADELFSITVDPHACTGCGVCVEVCSEEALEMRPAEPATLRQLEAQLGIWEQLPDTDSETIRRLIHREEYNSFAATLLSRHFYLTLTGGASSEAGAISKTNLHLLMAVAESVLQPVVSQHIAGIEELIRNLSDNIHDHLSKALPDKDLHLLARGMQGVQDDKLPLDAVIRHLSREERPALLDTDMLRRKTQLLDDLDNLRSSLTEGPTGNGRARLGLALSNSGRLPWADDFPYNPFTMPVLRHWNGQAPQQVIGLVKGWQRHVVDQVRLLRRAALEVSDKYRPDIHDHEIAAIQWEGLDEMEKRLLPPVLLVSDAKNLGASGISGLQDLLTSQLPVKVLILDDATRSGALSEGLLLQIAALHPFTLVKGSVTGDSEHYDNIRAAIHISAPALIHLLVPDPEQHRQEYNNWKLLTALAWKTRAFTSFHYDPEQKDYSLASALSLGANPAADKDWVRGELIYEENGEEVKKDYTYTYADWLFTQQDWQAHFHPAEPGEATVTVAEYLNFEQEKQTDKIPVVWTIDEQRCLKQYIADPMVIDATQQILRQWIHLRELAGAYTSFPEKIRAALKQELEEKYERQAAAVKAACEAELQNREEVFMKRVRIQLREKLFALSKKGRQ